MARASGLRLRIYRTAIIWFRPAFEVCRAVNADPWATLASGTLLAAFAPGDAEDAMAKLASHGHRTSIVGQAEPGAGVFDEEGSPIHLPARDEVARILSRSYER